MAACEELALPARELPNVSCRGFIRKRSGGVFKSWNFRYVVISANFLITYMNNTDEKPRKVVCLDGCSVVSTPDRFKKRPFAFEITTRVGNHVLLAGDSQDESEMWIQHVKVAGYDVLWKRLQRSSSSRSLATNLSPLRDALRLVAPGDDDGAEGKRGGVGDGDDGDGGGGGGDDDNVKMDDLISVAANMRNTVLRLEAENERLVVELQAVRDTAHAAGSAAAGTGARPSEHDDQYLKLRVELEDQLKRNAQLQAELTAVRMAEEAEAVVSPAAASDKLAELEQRLRQAETLARRHEARSSELERRLAESQTRLAEEKAEHQAHVVSAAAAAAAAAAASASGGGEGGGGGGDGPDHSTPPRRSGLNATVVTVSPAKPITALGSSPPLVLVDPPSGHGKPTGDSASSRAPRRAPPPSEPTAETGGGGGGGGGGDPGGSVDPAPGSPSTKDPYEHEWAPFYQEAQALEKAGRLAEAEQQYQVVLDVRRERSGADSVAVAAASRDLGRVLALQRRFDRAEDHYSRAVDLCTRLLSEGHPNTACALTDLAAVQREQGKFSDAEKHAELAVHSLRLGVGPNDVSTATALYNLAGLAKRQGKYRPAEEAYVQALKIFRVKLGEGEGETADTLYQLGCLCRKTADYSTAYKYFRLAQESYRQAYGVGDRRVGESEKRATSMLNKLRAKRG